MIWRCPKCKSQLVEGGGSLVCSLGHNYDRAKQGYVNLLLANQKGSQEPGDSQAMILARSAFLRAGYYDSLVSALASTVEQSLHDSKVEELTLLDLGCGEGYYLESLLKSNKLNQRSGKINAFGMDVSKTAIRKAASSGKHLLKSAGINTYSVLDYAIASNSNIPVCDHSIDCILTVFAPVDSKELSRVLKPGAFFIRVSPGPRHLYQIRSYIYDTVNLHQTPKQFEELRIEKELFVKDSISLESPESIEQLLMMTPFNWNGKNTSKETLITQAKLSVEVDFLIQVCRKC